MFNTSINMLSFLLFLQIETKNDINESFNIFNS